jgi:2-dehydro-3-deoxyphosphogluconate aldolase / (4S)-4-hydroxy-2-oxoglutarate aldolase
MSELASASSAPHVLDVAPVIPVVVLEDANQAVPLAHALAAGGLPIVELTLRTPSALEAVRRIAAEVPDVLVGAGTILSARQAQEAAAAGAKFLVSPGSTPALLDAMDDTGLPFLPGTSTVSEMLAVAERGHTAMKFFPAEAAGGAPYLASLVSPLPHLRFCPTGGITAATAERYLRLPNVGCVGGSWLTPADAFAAGDWARVTRLAAEVTTPVAA